MGAAEKSTGAPLPAKLAGLLREAKWLVLVALAAYLLIVLATFQKSDPGWSHDATDALVRNAGGVAGAWVADLLLYLFGVSAYWWIALCVYIVIWGYRRLDSTNAKDFFRRLRIAAPFNIRRVQTDNGYEFCKYFTSYLQDQNLIHYWNFKGKPTMNCYVEKYNRTIQEEFIDQHEILLDEPQLFNKKLIDYLLWYNTERPHWSLGLKSPVDYMLTTNSLSRMRWTDT